MPRRTKAQRDHDETERARCLEHLRKMFPRKEYNRYTDDRQPPTVAAVLMYTGSSRNGYPARVWRLMTAALTDKYGYPTGTTKGTPTLVDITSPVAYVLGHPDLLSHRPIWGIRTQDDPEYLVQMLAGILYHDDPHAAYEHNGIPSNHGISTTRITG